MLSGSSKPTQRKKIYKYYKKTATGKFSNTSRKDLEGIRDNSYKILKTHFLKIFYHLSPFENEESKKVFLMTKSEMKTPKPFPKSYYVNLSHLINEPFLNSFLK